jgi:hypothetical protein
MCKSATSRTSTIFNGRFGNGLPLNKSSKSTKLPEMCELKAGPKIATGIIFLK